MQLVQKEYKLDNVMGAGGSIDILARDSFGHLVIIEIKRSDQAARAALHELTKYVALLKSAKGIQPDRIRALLLSTEWHELTVPFSEYLKSAEVATEGIVIEADESGQVTALCRFEPINLTRPLRLERAQAIYFFDQASCRDRSIAELAVAADQASISDFVIYSVDYSGQNSDVIYPYAAYFAFSCPCSHESADELESFLASTGMEWEELEDPGENFLFWLGEFTQFERSDLEIGYPEKFASMTAEGWSPRVSHRSGRYSSNIAVLSDAALISEAMRVEGGAAHYLFRTASPKFKPSWTAFKNDLALVLLGCSAWEEILGGFIAQIQAERPDSTISAHVYNPADLVVALAKAFASDDYRYFASFQLIESSSARVCVYVGALVWASPTVKISSVDFLEQVFGGLENYLIARALGEQHDFYDAACAALGLESVVFEILNPGSLEEQVRLLRSAERPDFSDYGYSSLAEFISENKIFGANLVTAVKSIVIGLV